MHKSSKIYNLDIALDGVFAKAEPRFKTVAFGNRGDYVVLLHGMLRNYKCMSHIAEELGKAGFIVLNFAYPAKKYGIEILATHFLKKYVQKHCTDPKKKIHFVGHSLGGIVIRKYLQDFPSLRAGRVVMIASPNHGSEVATFLKDNAFFKWLCGPTLKELGAHNTSYVNTKLKQKVNFDLGVIAGNKSINPLSILLFKEENDGMVSVQNTRVLNMKDHIVFNCWHMGLIKDEYAIKQTKHFLLFGRFYK